MTKMMFKSFFAGMMTVVFACILPGAVQAQTEVKPAAAKTTAATQQPEGRIAPAVAMQNYNPVPAQPSTVKNFPVKQPAWLDTSPKLPPGTPPVVRRSFQNSPPANKNLPPGKKDKTGEKQ